MGRLRRLMPSRIGSQIALLSLIAIAITAGIVFAATLHFRDPFRADGRDLRIQIGGLFSTIRMVATTSDPAQRATVVAAARRAFPDVNPAIGGHPTPKSNLIEGERMLLGFLREDFGSTYEVNLFDAPADGGEHRTGVYFRLPDGMYLTGLVPQFPPPPPPFAASGLVTLAISAGLSLLLIVPWAAWWLARPLARFAREASDFSPERDFRDLPEDGPDEIKAAARAFNRMRQRIGELVTDRMRMLAAVGHDLRTPITRLRLRAEFIDDLDQRASLLRDLDRMNSMVEGALSFLKTGQRAEAEGRLDLVALVQTVCDDFADMGADVTVTAPDRLLVTGRMEDLHRAIANLVDNGIKYGTTVRVFVTDAVTQAEILVEDDGPGISEAERPAMLDPFVRGDQARGTGAGSGFGLGLSIASEVVRLHGGTLTLGQSDTGGLSARITLPIGSEPPTGGA